MNFYIRLFADGLSGGGSDNYTSFKACLDKTLTNITEEMLEGVNVIRPTAFHHCPSLTSVTIPSSVTSIGYSAFLGSPSLTSVTISSSVTSIGGWVFTSCTSLKSVTVLRTTPPTLGSGVFNSTSSNLKIYVPAESVNAYKTATNWKSYASKIQAIPS